MSEDPYKQVARSAKERLKKRVEPLWKGPEKDGVTFSLLSRFLVDRERFRVHVVEGLRPASRFEAKMEFGNMWHLCEEWHLKDSSKALWTEPLREYATNLAQRYPHDGEVIDRWYRVCKMMFPEYADFWDEHPDHIERDPLFQEQVFDEPYKLPSGRVVRLRGKWDGGFLTTLDGEKFACLQENKTKTQIDEDKVRRQLRFDLQTMLYLVALKEKQDSDFWNRSNKRWRKQPVGGVLYNVVKRPSHYPGKKESLVQFCDRLLCIISESPADFFARWLVKVSPSDVERFQVRCLNPVLEQLCDWWEYIDGNPGYDPFLATVGPHWQHPFGVFNVLDEGGSDELDEYVLTGSRVGLEQSDNLFPELS